MSDFLSKFNKDQYDELVNEKEKDTETEKPSTEKVEQTETKSSASEPSTQPIPSSSNEGRRYEELEETEIDPTYKRKKRRTIIISIVGGVLALLLIFFIYDRSVHVAMEDFVGQPVSEARAWAAEYNIEIDLTHESSMEYDTNQVMSQAIPAGDRVRKGETISLVSSTGPDPDEHIELPDFTEMSQYEAETWIADYKVENLQLLSEYNDDVEEGEFIRLVIRDSNVAEEEYRRRDSAIVYYSRGEEVFEKDIDVPDFTGQTRVEVEQWAETNEIEITYKEEASNSVEVELVVSQSVSPEDKVAKRDEMEVVISLGQATTVPHFGELTMEEATSYGDLVVMVQQRYHSEVPFGGLISQSVSAGTELTDRDNKEIQVVYSQGRPYLRDYRGMLEGDLPQAFYEDYQSKGADIRYTVKYVDAPEVKGTVVGMSKFNEFVSMSYTVEIRISNNANASSGSWDDEEDIQEEISPIEETPQPGEEEEK
ncbi:PASTA domain-containing protein [Halalkalibacter sp. APA_J-10(15)]|uniref:PASTA domain-containing protein n=1 Tax=Halalkalibacter sp. APA_J-10(15) TaxID=2933805 RepID=UPI001FF5FF72|nr:PASTA domain-containing protein [Halalkalibacter sp. APA_J-10(15)]MCK0469887.1 PASTA domain-containing protein [Halalkalibacter sp. APA_J-10(15)]